MHEEHRAKTLNRTTEVTMALIRVMEYFERSDDGKKKEEEE